MEILQGENSCLHGTKGHPPLFLEGSLLGWQGEPAAGIDVTKISFFSVGCIIPCFKGGWDTPFPDKGIACFGHKQHQFFKTFLLISQGGADSYI